MPSAPKLPQLQVLGACAALLSVAPSVARAQSAPPSAPAASAALDPGYERLRAGLKAARVQSPDQVRELRAGLASKVVEFSARVAGVMSTRRGRVVLLQYADAAGQAHSVVLEVSPAVASDAASMRSLRADATVRILARVNGGEIEPMLTMLSATDKAAVAPLFRDQGDGDTEIMSPVNGALPLPAVEPQMGAPTTGLGDAAEAEAPDPFTALPRARVPANPRTPLVPMAPPTSSSAAPGAAAARRTSPASRSMRAPRGYLAPPGSTPPVASAQASAPRAVPSLSPEFTASAQQRAPRAPAQAPRSSAPRAQSPAQAPAASDEPMMFADDERIESQVPAYENLVRRFNKKLSPELVEEIARGLLNAAYSQNMDPRFLAAIVAVESDFDPRCLSSSGAMGLGQVMPFNMPEVGMQKADAWNPTKNLLATAMLLRGHLDDFKSRPNGTLLAVAAYNAGPNAVKRAGYKVPRGPQVQRYVWKVYYRYKEFAPELFK